jgi:predicted HD phosphohydrolase
MTIDVPAARSLEEVLELLRVGPVWTGEEDEGSFGTLDHELQCAAILLEERPEDVELQVAGLLHDVGHRLTPGHPELHGLVGSRFLRELFGERIADLVELHVDAKRYLVAVDPDYRALLSPGSAATLIAQGEALDQSEVETFDHHPQASDAVVLRRADEGAKVPGRVVPGLETWVPVMAELVDARRASDAPSA